MAMVKYKECASIGWDVGGAVRGVQVRFGKNGGLDLVASVKVDDPSKDFSARMAEVNRLLAPNETQFVVLAGDIPGSVCFEVLIPRMPLADIPNAIRFELPQQLPFPPEEMVWGYRLIQYDLSNDKTPYRAKIFAVQGKRWNEFIESVGAAKIKADFYVHPFSALDPLFTGKLAPLSTVDSSFVVSRSQVDKMLQPSAAAAGASAPLSGEEIAEALGLNASSMSILGDESLLDYTPCVLAAAFVMQPAFEADRASMLNLPHELIPVRFSGIKLACLMLSIFSAVFLLGYGGRTWFDNKAVLDETLLAGESASKEFDRLKKSSAELRKVDELINGLDDADLGNKEMLFCVQELTKAIPKGYWVQTLSATGNVIDLTLIQEANSQTTLKRLEDGGVFHSVNTKNKRKNVNESTTIQVGISVRPDRVKSDDKGGK